ncbi:TPA: DUF1642 domain-containing protein [Streptococcus agalactiae]
MEQIKITGIGTALFLDRVNRIFAISGGLTMQWDFISAWMHGYTIEKEKLYTVEIPNPNSDLKIILVKVNKKLKLIEAYEDQLEEYKNIRNVTESEIRKDFDWAWQFREEVAE